MHSELPGHRPGCWAFLAAAADAAEICAIGVAPAGPVPSVSAAEFRQWLSRDGHADMEYMRRWESLRLNPQNSAILPGAAVVVSAAFSYAEGCCDDGLWSLVAAHARARDYHRTLKHRLKEVARCIQEVFPTATWRVCVDSAPIMERTWAVQCGLGTIGRNGALMVPGVGPRVLLGEIICAGVSLPDVVAPVVRNTCEDCHRCTAACPTGALDSAGRVDARSCLSYHSVENRADVIPSSVRPKMTMLFGCDICTAVCPALSSSAVCVLEPLSHPGKMPSSLPSLLSLPEGVVQDALSGSCLARTGEETVRRNGIAILNNRSLKALEQEMETRQVSEREAPTR